MRQKIKIKFKWKTGLLAAVLFLFSTFAALAEEVTLDKSGLTQGLIKISTNIKETTKVKLLIQKDDKKYYYDLKNDGKAESFPLQLGNGDYKITAMKNIVDTKYSPVFSETVTLSLKDQNTVFLQSVQNINWNMETKAVAKAKALIKGYTEGQVKLEKVYEFIVANYRYDFDKASAVKPGYIPIVDDTYTSKKGICYDYSALFASMLRSFGVPTRLVKGYSSNVEGYHAWNEVYDAKSKTWIVIDTTFDAQMKVLKKKTTLKKPYTEYQNVNIY